MDLMKIGKEARKTGMRAREDIIRDKYDMEDIDDFFDDVDSPESTNRKRPEYMEAKEPTVLMSARGGLSAGFESEFGSSYRNEAKSQVSNLHLEFNTESAIRPHNRKSSMNEDLRSHTSKETDAYKQKETPSAASITRMMAVRNNGSNRKLQDLATSSSFHSPIQEAVNAEPDEADDLETHESKGWKTPPRFAKSSVDQLSGAYSRHRSSPPPDTESEGDLFEWDNNSESSEEQVQKFSKAAEEYDGEDNLTTSLPSPPPDSSKLRRSRRTKVRPLEYWRNERIIYSRAEDISLYDKDSTLVNDLKKIPLQEIRKIIHVEDSSHKSKRKRVTRQTSKKPTSESASKVTKSEDATPDWFTKGVLNVEIFINSEQSDSQEVAWCPDGVEFLNTAENGINSELFQAAPLFRSPSGILSSGLLELPLNGFKSLRSSNDSTCVFHVSDGRVEVKLNSSRFVVLHGCSFVVPIGNMYGLRNVGSTIARLFFVQCRESELDKDS